MMACSTNALQRRPVTAVLVCATLIAAPLCSRAAPTSVDEFQEALRTAESKMRSRDWADAQAQWEKVVKANPVAGPYWQGLAVAAFLAKDYKRAIAAYEKTIELRAGFPWASAYSIAGCYAQMGDKEQAIKALQRAFDMGWRDLGQPKLDRNFESLRDDQRFKDLVGIVDMRTLTRDEGWRYDLRLLAREMKRLHYDLRRVPKPEFDALVKKLDEEIPKLTDQQVTVGFMKLARMAGDGHTHFFPAVRKGAPVQFYYFSEGVFITAVDPAYTDLLGAQLLKVGDLSVEKTTEAMDAIISQDNKMGIVSTGPGVLRRADLLNGLGIVPTPDRLPITVKDVNGKTRTVTLPSDSDGPAESWTAVSNGAPSETPLYLKDRKSAYWFEYLPATKTVYFQYNAVRSEPKETLSQFCDRLFKYINDNDVARLVIDLRWNVGGNTFLNQPIVHGLIKCDKINKRGKLFVIVGRQTFSAAMNCATFIERNTSAIFVGEPTGSSPNFVGETVRLTLPFSKMQGSISDLYWESSWPMDYRTWIPPTLYAPLSFEAYKANRDPAMEAIMAYRDPAPIGAPVSP